MHHLSMRVWFATNFSYRIRPGFLADVRSVPGSARLFVLLTALLLSIAGCSTTSHRTVSAIDVEVLPPEPTIVSAPPAEPVVPKPAPVTIPQTNAPAAQPSTNAVAVAVQPPVMAKPTVIPEPKHPINNAASIALTFDDGPNPRNTPALLDILKERGIHATFFVLGQNASLYPGILQRMVAEGHEIANHSWNHLSFEPLTIEQRTSQVRKTNEAIERAIGHPPRLIRPPYGATNPNLNRWLEDDQKMSVVLWSVDSRDWERHDPNSIRREILTATKPGSIILAHDIHRTTVSAMPGVLDELLAKGYRFVTVSELMSIRNLSSFR